MAIWLAIDPDGANRAASWPKSEATDASRALIVGSSPYTSSPTTADAIAARMPDVGRVTVSERKSTRSATQHLRNEEGQLQRLLGVEPGVTGRLVPVGQVEVFDALGAAQALGHVLAGQFDVEAARV